MNRFKTGMLVAALVLGFATAGWTQGMGRGMGPRPPQMLGEFKPEVGSGAQYQMTFKNNTTNFAYAIVGTENVEGKAGYWMEIRSGGGAVPGEMVMKQLLVLGGDKPEIKRMIMQPPGRPAVEMPVAMMMGMGQRAGGAGAGAVDTSPGEKVGTETITVPAGTFECDHYRKQTPGGSVDVWISNKVSPYGVVKMSGGEMSMVLAKTLTHEVSHIQGEPQQMNIPVPRQ